MRRNMVFVLCVLLAVTMASGVFAAGQREDVQFIRIGTAGSGGNYYRLGAGMASLWNDEVAGVQASIQATGGAVANAELLANGEVEIAFMGSDPAYEAYNNLGQWADKPAGRYQNMAFVSHMYPNPQYFVAMQWAPEIRTLHDIRGKRVSKGTVGSHGEFLFNQTLDLLGWTYNDVIAEDTVHQATIDQVRNRQIDAIVWPDAVPSPSITEVMETGFARLLSFPPEIIDGMTRDNLNFPLTIPANTYANQPQPVDVFAYSVIFVVWKDVSDDVIYNFIKAMYENHEYLIGVYPIV
jgi:TRAP transporter TAXI family solute receptor